MWQIFDIAYVIPVTVGLAYLVYQYCFPEHFTACILSGAALGLILSIVKIKRYIDQINKK